MYYNHKNKASKRTKIVIMISKVSSKWILQNNLNLKVNNKITSIISTKY